MLMAQAAGLAPGAMGVSVGGGPVEPLSSASVQNILQSQISAKLAEFNSGAGGPGRSSGSDLNNYGIVLQTDPKSRTAHVKWVSVKTKPGTRHHHKGTGVNFTITFCKGTSSCFLDVSKEVGDDLRCVLVKIMLGSED